ncbi:alkaline phosphatase [Moritella viscosa]|uniref:Alkaline phosphatase n=1 Tax=Moritella viscosa TaxID=80854 RepID=A0A090K7T3_9GAMM|nr:alkaline phosphatase [Moritella viscosa]CED59863.1 alkaline phosphatase [Moritella viscosa]SGY87277.1 Alkaline phosphatase [Moritella viscosa]SGY90338.1 Alkaline phosphatase [Moritella viscosa]SGY92883.1 Alkaline phosphatase [Moritella viscosa]SGY93503.1 Alkaline phosphatase [Moritella viscosa]
MIKNSVLILAISSVFLSACNNSPTSTVSTPEPTKVKNLILMIGDGMGPQQVGLLEEYAQRAPLSIYNDKGNKTALSTFADAGQMGLSLNAPYGNNGSLVVDSACSATQLATGLAAGSEMIGLDRQGNVVETILEKAKAQGKATGLVSDTRITHATPAAFAAHQPHRSYEAKIAEQLIESGSVDVMLSGGTRVFLPADIKTNQASRDQMAALGIPNSLYKKSKRKDQRNLLLEAKEQYGYNLSFNKDQLTAAEGTKLLGLFANSGMADGIAYTACKQDNSCTQPSLRDMTIKALDILSKDEDGFFLMIEGGQIDWAGHVNDAGWMLHELIKFDEAVAAVYDWVKDRNDSLVIVTADHETGSFGFSYSRNDLPEAQHLTGNGMQGKEYKPNFNFGELSQLDKLYAQSGTFYAMMDKVSADWDFKNTTGQQWADAINSYSVFKVTAEQAAPVALREKNEYHVAGHKYLSAKEFPKVNDFKEFYVYGDELHANLIGRVLGTAQNVVWGTGTHTASPVPVYAFGPESITKQFSTMQHHVELSQKMADALL